MLIQIPAKACLTVYRLVEVNLNVYAILNTLWWKRLTVFNLTYHKCHSVMNGVKVSECLSVYLFINIIFLFSAKPLCHKHCNGDNTVCVEKDPQYIAANNTWSKGPNPVSCDCQKHFDWYSASPDKPVQCTAVCSIRGCTENGECRLVGNRSAECYCHEDYYGLRCEESISSDAGWIVSVCLLSVLAIVAIIAAIFFWR